MTEGNKAQLYFWNEEKNTAQSTDERWDDLWEYCNVAMGSGFLSALNAPAPMKDYIEGQSRLEHGKVVLVANARQASRDLTLSFNIHGESEAEMHAHRDTFYSLLYRGKLTLKVTYKDSGREDVYNLIYKKSTSYSQGYSRLVCTVAVKFEEPNPTNRTAG